MLSKLSRGLYHWVNWKWVVASVVIFACFIAFILPWQAAKSEEVTGSGESPDTSFLYSANDLYQMAEQYGEEGRSAYIQARFTFDLVWPIVYLFLLLVLLSILYRVIPPENRWRRLNLLPVGGWALDMLENAGASLTMYRYPVHTPVVAELTPIFTLLKWCLISASFAALVPGIILSIFHYARTNRG
ncbi:MULTISPECIES: hypothetical protein [Paenibacillus]|uniref:hypothetical protein n=1 Tax=Paenibacillus TaxID=44249 RepID=UPI0007BEBE2D|nr:MULTISPECIES: hypothetical protein [Paenibacillus]MCZ1265448.1 hypothetical protein [Paenibacillus tundrae]